MSTMDKIQELKASRSAVEKSTKAARERIAALLDPQSFVEVGAYVKSRSTDFNVKAQDTPADGVVTGYGTIEDRLVYVYSQEASVLGGAVGEMHAAKIAALYQKAVEMGAPIVGIIDSQGLRMQELTDALAGYGKIYAAQAKASGVVPQITVVAGTAAGGAAVIPGLSDFTFMIDKQSKVFVSSANAMEKGTAFDDIAAAGVHGAKTGLADFVCADEAECFAKVRALVDMLPANNGEDAPIYEELDDLNALNEKVKAQGGEVIGINTETLDGNQQGIDAAKKLLAATGASYRNIYFASGSEAGKFALNIMAFPTTYVFDRDGNVVGQPLLGGIDKEENLAALQKNIDAALAKDSAK